MSREFKTEEDREQYRRVEPLILHLQNSTVFLDNKTVTPEEYVEVLVRFTDATVKSMEAILKAQARLKAENM